MGSAGLELQEKPYLPAQSEALAAIRTRWRREWDSNPRDPKVTVFETVAIDHSATSPKYKVRNFVRQAGFEPATFNSAN